MFKGFKAVVVVCVVACGDNSKVERCGVSVCCCKVVVVLWIVYELIIVFVVVVVELGIERTPTHVLPNRNRRLYESILTDLHTPAIHITVYLILIFQVI